MNWLKLFFMITGTAFLAWVSRKPIRQPGSHGFYRFFAWEVILALFLLNVQRWFVDPFSWRQWIAWVLLLLSVFLALQGFYWLRAAGKPDASRTEASLLALEKTTHLVRSGAYQYIRHPLYASLLLLLWGIFFKDPSWTAAGLALGGSAFLALTASAEEIENVQYFGEEYRDYQCHTWRFIPYIY